MTAPNCPIPVLSCVTVTGGDWTGFQIWRTTAGGSVVTAYTKSNYKLLPNTTVAR